MNKVESEKVRQHVIKCSICVVAANGEVFYCTDAQALVQEERKRKFFGL